MDEPLALRFAVALGLGMLIGLERERAKGEEGGAGVRTFALIALAGAIAGYLQDSLGLDWFALAIFFAVGARHRHRRTGQYAGEERSRGGPGLARAAAPHAAGFGIAVCRRGARRGAHLNHRIKTGDRPLIPKTELVVCPLITEETA